MRVFNCARDHFTSLFAVVLLIALSGCVESASAPTNHQQTISCHAARIAPKKSDWTCTATCREGSHIATGGLTAPPGTSVGPFSDDIDGNGWRCDFGKVTGCTDKRSCPVTCDAVCADGQ